MLYFDSYICENNGDDTFDKYKGVDISGLKTISEAKELLEREEKEVKRHQVLLKLTKLNLIGAVKQSVHYIYAYETILKNAQHWLTIKKDCDKRRKYEEKTSYNLLSKELSETLEINNVEIIDIRTCGLEIYAYAIDFITNSYDYIFQLEIPLVENITIDNMQYTQNGKLLFGYKENDSTYWHSYNIRDFRDAIHEIVTSKKHQKHISSARFKDNQPEIPMVLDNE